MSVSLMGPGSANGPQSEILAREGKFAALACCFGILYLLLSSPASGQVGASALSETVSDLAGSYLAVPTKGFHFLFKESDPVKSKSLV